MTDKNKPEYMARKYNYCKLIRKGCKLLRKLYIYRIDIELYNNSNNIININIINIIIVIIIIIYYIAS